MLGREINRDGETRALDLYYLWSVERVGVLFNLDKIGEQDWHSVGGGESGYVVAKPDDPSIVVANGYWTQRNYPPEVAKQTAELAKPTRKLTARNLQRLMSLSDNLAKLNREHRLRERRLEKQAKKDARKLVAAQGPDQPNGADPTSATAPTSDGDAGGIVGREQDTSPLASNGTAQRHCQALPST